MKSIFNTDRRIKLGIWGLGRGQSFILAARSLNIDVVAGCDIHPHMRESFLKNVPGAVVTADEDEFLALDFDAVLIATYFRDHAKHTIKALEAGKHVMCEVTSFFTPAEGVRVVEAVENSGKIYNLLENYPFTRDNMFLKKLYEEGFFGDFMYAEFEYLHETRRLSYAYNVDNGLPVEPGYTVHNWRSALNCHYYNTHSLGPVMNITGLRPVSVTAPPCDVTINGYLEGVRKATAHPSMIRMSNGGLMRNLMGETTNDYHASGRFWGTMASAEKIHGLKIRVGASGNGLLLNIKSEWPELGELAESTGHGGGDFWELYYFVREILTGETAPWDIYSAADVTLAGIMAARSCATGGVPVQIPDFRVKAERDKYRCDDWSGAVENFDPQHIFPDGHDPEITGSFTTVMTNLFPGDSKDGFPLVHSALDGMRLYPHIADDTGRLNVVSAVNLLIHKLPEIAGNCRIARSIADAYPDCVPGRTLCRLLAEEDIEKIENTEITIAELRAWLDTI